MRIILFSTICRRKRRKEEPVESSTNGDEGLHNGGYQDIGSTESVSAHVHSEESSASVQMKSFFVPDPSKKSATSTPPSVVYLKPAATTEETEDLPEDPDAEEDDEDSSDPYYNHVPKSVSVDKLKDYVQDRLDGVGFENEYSFLPPGLLSECNVGTTDQNILKNRYRRLFAYDHSRVVLQRDNESELEGETDYINASYIHGYTAPKKFIATQGPISETVYDFWLMVWQQNTKEIIMLANIYEDQRKKCEEYWPERGEPTLYDDLTVSLLDVKQYCDCNVRHLLLHHIGSDTKREITQFHFTTWPDHSVPSAPTLVSFWRRVKRHVTFHEEQKRGPMVVHCSAGVGRTGTLIGLDYLFDQATAEGKVNIFTAVLEMRRNRLKMVQTKGQYTFLHLALLEALNSKSPRVLASQIPLKLQPGSNIIEDEHKHLKLMSSIRIPKENSRKGREHDKHDEEDSDDESVCAIGVTVWPTYFDVAGFLHVGDVDHGVGEELWNLIDRKNIETIIAINHSTLPSLPVTVGTSERIGDFELTLTSETSMSSGITERKITSSLDSYNRQMGDTNIVMYSIEASTQQRFNKTELLKLIHLLNFNQAEGSPGPILLLCRNKTCKCAMFAAAANIITCLSRDKEVDVYLLVREIQWNKGQPVTCQEDYRFLYDLANDYVQLNVLYDNLLDTGSTTDL